MLQLVNLSTNWDRLVRTDGRKVEPLPDVAPERQWVIVKATRRGGETVRMVAACRRPTANVPRGLQRTYLLNDALGAYSAPPNPAHRGSFSSDVDGLMQGMDLHDLTWGVGILTAWERVMEGV